MTQAPHTEAAEYAADHASGVFPPFDPTYFPSQLFWLAISFIALYIALDRFILPKIKTTIEDRKDRIADDLDAAAQAKADAEAAGEAYEQALADARSKAHGIAGETRKALDAELAADLPRLKPNSRPSRKRLKKPSARPSPRHRLKSGALPPPRPQRLSRPCPVLRSPRRMPTRLSAT